MPDKFNLGAVVITKTALAVLRRPDIDVALERHRAGDWGDLCEHDRKVNEEGLLHGGRLFSAYTDSAGTRFWIITEWDRSATTVLLPEDY